MYRFKNEVGTVNILFMSKCHVHKAGCGEIQPHSDGGVLPV